MTQMTPQELRQFNQDTLESIRGKNNWSPKGHGEEKYWPKHNPYDIPGPGIFNEIDHPKD